MRTSRSLWGVPWWLRRAEYAGSGVRSFIVSHDGVVYEKDFGAKALDEFEKMKRFNPDKS